MISTKPVWQMNNFERSEEQRARISAISDFFLARGAATTIAQDSLNVETPKNNYCFDVAAFDPRFLKVEIFYEVESNDLSLASWACYEVQAKIHVGKAKVTPIPNGYRLSFFTETLADSIEDFLKVAVLHIAIVEDCRDAYLKIVNTSLAEEDLD